MSLLTRMRKQWAVYWAPAGTDSHNKVKYAPPVEIKVRWQDSTELFTNKAGEQQVSKSQVYFGPTTVDGDELVMAEQGVLWLGPKNGTVASPLDTLDQDHKDNPFKNLKAWSIQRVDVQPDLKVREFLRIAYL